MAVNETVILLNETINQTVNATAASSGTDIISYVSGPLYSRIHDLLLAPFEHPDMLWTLWPMIIALVLMQLYFGRNKEESLGWNTAFGNSVALIFISGSLLRGLFIISGEATLSDFVDSVLLFQDIKIFVIAFLLLYGVVLSMTSFFHWLPERLAFFIMNGLSINVTAYVGIVLVNSDNIALDWTTVFAGLAIFVGVYIVAMVVRYFVPASDQAKLSILKQKKSILQSNVELFEKKGEEAKSDRKKAHYQILVDKYTQKVHKINSEMKKLE
ncbi:MAG: hypothetical protein ABIA62_01460 [Candidatus Woesearchaeota archaeon]